MDTPPPRKRYVTDVSDDDWAFLAPYLALMRDDAIERTHSLSASSSMGCGSLPGPGSRGGTCRTICPRSTPSINRCGAGWDGAKRRKGSKIHLTVDTLGHLLVLHVTPANDWDRTRVAELAAADQGIALEVVKLPAVKRGFVLWPRRWVVEWDFGWMSRFRRLARDQERLAEVLKGFHQIAFTMLMWKQVRPVLEVL
jgi:transposase